MQAAAQSPSQWVSTLYLHRLDQIDALSWQWIDHHENLVEQVWHTQQGVFRRKRPLDVGSRHILHFFFELMPCALEAQTVIKTFCLRLAIPTCWRIGDSKELGVFKTTQTQKQQTNTKHKTRPPTPTTQHPQPKRTPRTKVKHYAFRKVPMPLSTAPR